MIPEPPHIPRRGRPPVFPAAVVVQARALAAAGLSYATIGRALGVDATYARRLARRTARKDVP